MLSRAYRKDSIPQQGRETAALRDFKPASAETRVGARPVPASSLQNRMVGFPGTGRTELAELERGDPAGSISKPRAPCSGTSALPQDRSSIVVSNPLADLGGGESSYVINRSPSL